VKQSLAGLHAALDEKNIPHTFPIEGGGHAWPVWNNDVYCISQLLFRREK
jgi:S-formylglutathione hydrolase FrmB